MAGPGGRQPWLLQPPTPRKSPLTDTPPRARVSDAAEPIAVAGTWIVGSWLSHSVRTFLLSPVTGLGRHRGVGGHGVCTVTVQPHLLCRRSTIGRTAERRATGGQVARRPPRCLPYPVTVGVPSSTRPVRDRCVQERRRSPAPLKAVPFRDWRLMCVPCLCDGSPLVSQNFSLPLSDSRADSVGWRLARPERRIVTAVPGRLARQDWADSSA
ncbi:hypothetical protein chiPu_0022322 [Chiloscyllium punctatum]|uniref:Uncharacterized protein n=1 Tax=Chiloscyllium punctatum TaxID=137246 RepID=A0A401RIA1_CHIPU|nr:hypothetical protein [Chiloscyllium punctatum]